MVADSYIFFFDNFILLGFYARDIWSFVLCRIIWQVFGVAVEVAMWVAEDTMLNCHHLLVLQAFTFLMAQLACLPVIEA